MSNDVKEIKCLVWDLDNTIWDGVLLEGDDVRLKEQVPSIIKTLDERGILQSIASRNEYDLAMGKIEELSLADYFLYPQVTWGPKSESIQTIVKKLNIGADAVAFIDDDPYERDEVAAVVPDVLCIDASELDSLLDRPEMNPRFITSDSRRRRALYQAEIERQKKEAVLPSDEFLASLNMVFTISEAGSDDLARIEELTVRTNQLNSTGFTCSYEELDTFRQSTDHKLLIAGLDDRYGTYGKIGMALVELRDDCWMVKLLLMSCRVMSRGVGKVLLAHLLQMAAKERKRLCAEFVRTDRNRMMYLAFKIAGFKETSREGNVAFLEHDLETIDPFPDHVTVNLGGEPKAGTE